MPLPRQMADNSFAWAASRGLTRTNPVHKVEEAKLVLEETFASENERGERTEMSGSATIEECGWVHISRVQGMCSYMFPRQTHKSSRTRTETSWRMTWVRMLRRW